MQPSYILVQGQLFVLAHVSQVSSLRAQGHVRAEFTFVCGGEEYRVHTGGDLSPGEVEDFHNALLQGLMES